MTSQAPGKIRRVPVIIASALILISAASGYLLTNAVKGEATWIIGILFGIFTAITGGVIWRAIYSRNLLYYSTALGFIGLWIGSLLMLTGWVPDLVAYRMNKFGSAAVPWVGAAEIWYRQKQQALKRIEESHPPRQKRVLHALLVIVELLPLLIGVVNLAMSELVFRRISGE